MDRSLKLGVCSRHFLFGRTHIIAAINRRFFGGNTVGEALPRRGLSSFDECATQNVIGALRNLCALLSAG